jgi:hypothetical protein
MVVLMKATREVLVVVARKQNCWCHHENEGDDAMSGRI